MPHADLYRGPDQLRQLLKLKTRYLIGRDVSCCDVVVPKHWHGCSRLQAELYWTSRGWVVQDGVDGHASTNGTFHHDGSSFKEPAVLGSIHELTLLVGMDPDTQITIHIKGLGAPESFPISTPSLNDETAGNDNRIFRQAVQIVTSALPGTVTIGRMPSCSICLDDPTVSRLHAVLRPERNGTALVEDCSSNGLFIGGRKAGRISRIAPGTEVRIGRGHFQWDGTELLPQGDQQRLGIEVRDLELPERLQPMSLSITGGQLVALVGGSGAGKSSLLSTLAGQNPSYKGQVRIGGDDLKRSIDALRPLMGFVPQDDIVHPELSVCEVLTFAARLRIPDREARQPAVERVLNLLDMDHRRHALVRELSGGQRKRVNIGMELVADPRLLFLDEPTSGLDPDLDRRMMRLLRQLADRGHTVLVVTHATANVHLCDQLVFLARGGRLCYSGSPRGCLHHYGVSHDFADVYERLNLSDLELEQEAKRFNKQQSLPSLSAQSIVARSYQVAPAPWQAIRQWASQVKTVWHRELLVNWRDHISLGLNLLTSPVVILLLAAAIQMPNIFVLPSDDLDASLLPLAIKVIFVMSCVCIWTGISSHISTVARERSIYEREKSFNLNPLAYVAAKGLMILLLALPQSLLIALTSALVFRLPSLDDIGPSLIGYWMAAMFTILASGSMALSFSTLVTDQRQAASSSTLLLMPQLILSGVLFDIGSLATLYPLVASRWSVRIVVLTLILRGFIW
ncbi:MAG: ATP-binding cassette domain-containing protein [Cyanobium sp.]|jgi:ABC-type multidrug transport system ATPase subunit/pSer/pThr/pTyr-binding forkhead associated (FHA) protein